MNTTDTTLIQLMESVRSDVNNEVKSINNDVKSIKNDVSSINAELAEIKVKMSVANKQIFGCEKEKGLVTRVSDIETAISSGGLIWKAVVGFIAWAVSIGIAVYAAISK